MAPQSALPQSALPQSALPQSAPPQPTPPLPRRRRASRGRTRGVFPFVAAALIGLITSGPAILANEAAAATGPSTGTLTAPEAPPARTGSPVEAGMINRAPDVVAPALLEDRIDTLDDAVEAPVRDVDDDKPPEPGTARVTAAPGRGVTFDSLDGRYALTLRGRLQFRDTLTATDGDIRNEANLRLARLALQGHAYDPDLRYAIQLGFTGPDLMPDIGTSMVMDAWLEWTRWRDLKVRAGQFFVPLDRARTMSGFALQFVDRGMVPRTLGLDRDVGILFWSTELFGLPWLGYDVFLGGGEGRNRMGARSPGPLVVGRLTFRPYGVFGENIEGDLMRRRHPRLAIGIAGGYNHNTDRESSTFGPVYRTGRVSYAHAAVDVLFKYRGLSVMAEYIARHATQDTISGLVDGELLEEYTRSGHGYILQAGYMLTSRVEVAGRWEQLFAENDTDQVFSEFVVQSGRQAAGAMSYYVNGHAMKMQADYTWISGTRRASPGHQARLQLEVTF